jgi:hypothetical protein
MNKNDVVGVAISLLFAFFLLHFGNGCH